MKRILAFALVSSLILAALPSAALAGDRHAVSNRWAGVAIGAATVIAGGILLNALQAPVVAAPVAVAPPVVYNAPPPVVYAPPPVVYYTPPPVVYAPAPVVVHRHWGPPAHWRGWQRGPGHGW
ncbi:MAG TPA: hypothetical protein VLT62_14760 [Candidatus Methylomirabilis sp.]|nr:hypothetical protein [Candidatus Methylomirabilis sp.]